MKVEILPSASQSDNSEYKMFNARLVTETMVIAEISDAPHDIATKWAINMRDLHEEVTEIKYVGICMYCGSSERNGVYCLSCERVVR
jgi:hypothetical protein